MNALIEMSEASEIGLLKIDTERSELELFARNTGQWLPRIKNLCIELHGTDCEEMVLKALSNYSYESAQIGDLSVYRDIEIRS